MTDPKVLDELERMEKAAPRAPWDADEKGGMDCVWLDIEDADENEILSAPIMPQLSMVHPDHQERMAQETRQRLGTIEFVAALRNNASSLIADARRLQRIEAAAEYYLDATMELPPGCMAVERAQRELREALEGCETGSVEETR